MYGVSAQPFVVTQAHFQQSVALCQSPLVATVAASSRLTQPFDVTNAQVRHRAAVPISRRDCRVFASRNCLASPRRVVLAHCQRHRHQLPWDIDVVGVVML